MGRRRCYGHQHATAATGKDCGRGCVCIGHWNTGCECECNCFCYRRDFGHEPSASWTGCAGAICVWPPRRAQHVLFGTPARLVRRLHSAVVDFTVWTLSIRRLRRVSLAGFLDGRIQLQRYGSRVHVPLVVLALSRTGCRIGRLVRQEFSGAALGRRPCFVKSWASSCQACCSWHRVLRRRFHF